MDDLVGICRSRIEFTEADKLSGNGARLFKQLARRRLRRILVLSVQLPRRDLKYLAYRNCLSTTTLPSSVIATTHTAPT